MYLCAHIYNLELARQGSKQMYDQRLNNSPKIISLSELKAESKKKHLQFTA